MRSPLVLVPVVLKRSSLREPFLLEASDEDPYLNPALAARLKQDFDFPLPMAAKRRLLFLGGRESDQRAVFSFSLPTSESAQEASFLKTHYWIESSKNSNDEICDDNHHS